VFLIERLLILPFLARAYVLSSSLNSENLARAETALNELLDSTPADNVSIHQPRAVVGPNAALAKGRSTSRNVVVEIGGP
jgi:hypothetical protein